MENEFIYILAMLFGTFISSVSQVMLKKAAEKEYRSWIYEYLNPLVIVAYFIFFAATFLSIYAYKGIPLSLGAVLEATNYVYVTLWGVLIFKEKTNKKKILALVLIILGIIISSVLG